MARSRCHRVRRSKCSISIAQQDESRSWPAAGRSRPGKARGLRDDEVTLAVAVQIRKVVSQQIVQRVIDCGRRVDRRSRKCAVAMSCKYLHLYRGNRIPIGDDVRLAVASQVGNADELALQYRPGGCRLKRAVSLAQ